MEAVALDLSKFRVVKHVTRPLIKMELDRPYYVKIESAFFQAEQVKNPKKTKVMVNGVETEQIQQPPYIIHVVDLSTGVSAQMVANEVLKAELVKQYKDDSYVGKYFELTKSGKAEGKNYNTFGITELEPVKEESKTEETKTEASKKK